MARPDGSPRESRRSAWRWVAPLMMLATSLALSYGAYRLAGYSWDQVVSYKSPYTTMNGADFSGARPDLAKPVPDAQNRRVVMVLIDGLRDDASRTMDSISALRAKGADIKLTTPQPSLSYPCWTTGLTGAPPQISGVTTNWFEGPVSVETLFDVAAGSGRKIVISGPKDLDDMFRASKVATATTLVDWDSSKYRSGTIVDNALALDRQVGGADFIFVLLPDVDDVGHAAGGTSPEYAAMVSKVDADLTRLIGGLDDGKTDFVVFPDHGHIDTGGHGGWEDPVIHTFAALAGPGIKHVTAQAQLADIAPTVAVLAGIQAPLQGTGTAIDDVLADGNGSARDAEFVRAAGITLSYIRKVLGDDGVAGLEFTSVSKPGALAPMRADADAKRLAGERDSRVGLMIGAALAVVAFAIALGIASWRALVAAGLGAAAYVAVYNVLFFAVHRFAWSLSAFNEESQVQAFFNQRMLEAALAGLAAALVAALVYSRLRTKRVTQSRSGAAEWLALGGATVLLAQGLLVLQVALYVWRWSPSVTWILPDFREAFKYDLDLIQLTALGAAALLGPLAAWGIGALRRTRQQTA